MDLTERINNYLKESDEEYDLTYDERFDDDVQKLVKKMKGDMDDAEFDYGDARALAYIPKQNSKKFEKALDKMGVEWS